MDLAPFASWPPLLQGLLMAVVGTAFGFFRVVWHIYTIRKGWWFKGQMRFAILATDTLPYLSLVWVIYTVSVSATYVLLLTPTM